MVRLRRRHIVLLIEPGAAKAKRSRPQTDEASSHAASPARKRRRGEQSGPDGGSEKVSVLSSLRSKSGADGADDAGPSNALRGLTRLDVLQSLHQRASLQFSEEKAALMNGKLGVQHVDQKSGLALLFVNRAHIADWLAIIEGVRSFTAGSKHFCRVLHVAGSASQLKRALMKLSRGVNAPPALSAVPAADWSGLLSQVNS